MGDRATTAVAIAAADRIRTLEKRVDELEAQVRDLGREVEAMLRRSRIGGDA